VSNGQHDDAKLIGSVSRASSAWESDKLPDEEYVEEDGGGEGGEDHHYGNREVEEEADLVTRNGETRHDNEVGRSVVDVVDEYFTTDLTIKEESLSESQQLSEDSPAPQVIDTP
jgi:hypothetical protein